MSIRIAKKRNRTEPRSEVNIPNYTRLDITSASRKKLSSTSSCKDFSPIKGKLPPVHEDGLEFNNFENFWQYSKIYSELGHYDSNNITNTFTQHRTYGASLQTGSRRLRGTKGLIPIGSYHNGQVLDYIDSRRIYVIKYRECIKDMEATQILKNMYDSGENLLLLDFDGPSFEDYPQGLEINQDSIVEMFNNTKYSFGHAYALAMEIMGLDNDILQKIN